MVAEPDPVGATPGVARLLISATRPTHGDRHWDRAVTTPTATYEPKSDPSCPMVESSNALKINSQTAESVDRYSPPFSTGVLLPLLRRSIGLLDSATFFPPLSIQTQLRWGRGATARHRRHAQVRGGSIIITQDRKDRNRPHCCHPFSCPRQPVALGGSPQLMNLIGLKDIIQVLDALDLEGSVYTDRQSLVKKLQHPHVLRRSTGSPGIRPSTMLHYYAPHMECSPSTDPQSPGFTSNPLSEWNQNNWDPFPPVSLGLLQIFISA